ncbi:hypothetical protein JXA02_09695 [candidate division KSB1 bacterium]|nr:hypothetical protein [candidate division KSB1 bacterium]RQW04253.1 MAG: hypothetical protein EH222_11480 [candidate division KSB1 bacterium]
MKMSALRSVTALLFLCFSHAGLAQSIDSLAMSSISLSAFVEQNEVPQNRLVNFVLRLHWNGDLDRYEVHPFENPIVQNLQIQGSGSTNRVAEENGVRQAIREYTFTLKPEAIGMGYVESFIIKYTDLSSQVEHRLTTNRIPIKVIDPVPDPISRAWFIAPLIIVALAGAAFYFIQTLRKRKAERLKRAQEVAAMAVPIEENYLQQLKEIDLNEPTLDGGRAFAALSRSLRRFLHERFEAPGLEATTTQVTDYLHEHNFDDRIVNEIVEILTSADIIKFSGKTVDRPLLERAYTIVESILQKSLRGEIPYEREKTGNMT